MTWICPYWRVDIDIYSMSINIVTSKAKVKIFKNKITQKMKISRWDVRTVCIFFNSIHPVNSSLTLILNSKQNKQIFVPIMKISLLQNPAIHNIYVLFAIYTYTYPWTLGTYKHVVFKGSHYLFLWFNLSSGVI
jgi:hypothetical protein